MAAPQATSARVTVIDAADLPFKGLPLNGYVVFEMGKTKRKTKVIKKTQTPRWDESFTIALTGPTKIAEFTIMDDSASSKDPVGKTSVDLGKVAALSDEWHPLVAKDSTPAGKIHLKIELAATAPSKIPSSVVSAMKDKLKSCQDRSDPNLDLSNCYLPFIPKVVIEKFTFLTHLDLGFNSFIGWPDLHSFNVLEKLELRGNQLTEIPEAVGLCTSLKILAVNGNLVKPAIGKLTGLEILELSNNQKLDVFGILWNCYITGNPIEALPNSVGALKSLEIIDASCCALQTLPEEFTLMTRVMTLNLANNQLQELPDGIGRMTRLVSLNVMDNKLADFPLSVGYCVGLGDLTAGILLTRNPIRDQNMLEKATIGPDHLLDYLEKRLAMANWPKLGSLALPEDLGEGLPPPWAKPKPVQAPASTPISLTPAGPVTDPAVLAKMGALRKWLLATVRDELRNEIAKLRFFYTFLKTNGGRNDTRVATTLGALLVISHKIKYLNKDIAKIKPIVDFEDSKPRAMAFSDEEAMENIRSLTLTCLNCVDNALKAVQALAVEIPLNEIPKIIALVQIVSDIKKQLMAV